MVPQQGAYHPPAPLPPYPHPGAFPTDAAEGFARPEGLPLQVGIPVAGHGINLSPSLPSYPPLSHQQPKPNAETPAFVGNIPGPVLGQAILPYAAPAPKLINAMQAAAPNNKLMIPGQHSSSSHASNSFSSNTGHLSNPSTPSQGYGAPAPNLMNAMQAAAPDNELMIPGLNSSSSRAPNSFSSNTRHLSNPSTPWQGYAAPVHNLMNAMQAAAPDDELMIPGQHSSSHAPNSLHAAHAPNSFSSNTRHLSDPSTPWQGYAASAPNLMNAMQAAAPDNELMIPGQHSPSHAPNSFSSITHLSNPSTPWQGYAAPAPNLMTAMQAAAPNNELIIPGQHSSSSHASNSFSSNTRHLSNHSTPWQGQPASSCPPSQAIFPAPASCLQSNAPQQNFIPAVPGLSNEHPHLQTSCQGFSHQEQPVSCTQLPTFAAPHGCQTNSQFCATNGTAIGVPVMGAPIYKVTTHATPSTVFPGHQPGQPWQQVCSENPAPTVSVPQSSKTFFSLTKYYRGNNPSSFPVPNPETPFFANGGQPLNAPRIEKPQNGPPNKHLRSSTGNPCSAIEQNSSTWPERTRVPMNGVKRQESQGNWACSQQEAQSSSIGQARNTFSQSNQGCTDLRGNNCSKGRGRRLDGWRQDHRRLRCDPCERTFSSMTYFESHISSHVKCGEEGCTFEASGKVIKEHKVVEHGKMSAPTTVVGRKALALRSTESEEEIRRWREERKINYPTTASILRKVKEMEDRKGRGEYFDGAAQKRRQSLREVLARQRELGIPVAEIPAHYLSEHNYGWQGPNRIGCNREVEEIAATNEMTMIVEDTVGDSSSQKQDLAGSKRSYPSTGAIEKSPELPDKKHIKVTSVQEDVLSEPEKVGDGGKDTQLQQQLVIEQNDVNIMHKTKSSCRKASRKESLHRRRQRKRQCDSDSASQKQPSLLSKLLESDIQRDKSHLLQCIRFIINNSFFEGWPTNPLKFFEWVEAEDLYSVDQANINKTHTADLQDFSNEERAHSSFTWEHLDRDICDSFGKNGMGELSFNVNDDITDSDEDGIFKYINLG